MTVNSNFDPGNIKHILFDLGGVLLNIDFMLTENAFKALGLIEFDEIYSQSTQEGFFDDFEKGFISEKEFVDKIWVKFNVIPGYDQIKKAWNAMLLDFPEERVKMLRILKNKYNLFLLSNTNEIHFNAFNKIFEDSFNVSFSSFFKKDFYSHLINMRKPDAEIFQYILDIEKLNKNELLFIDDTERHIKGAAQLGIQTLFLEKGDDIIQLLSRNGILT